MGNRTVSSLGHGCSGVEMVMTVVMPGSTGISAASTDRREAVTAATAADCLLVEGRGLMAAASLELEGSAMAGCATGRDAGA